MDCFCGCGTRVTLKLMDANLLASRMALELLAWDKARAQGRLGVDVPRLESMIDRGENSYGRLLLLIHGEGGPGAYGAAQDWMREAAEARAGRVDMATKGSILTQPQLLLDEEDYAVLDRLHPGCSYSRLEDEASEGGGEGDRAVPEPSPATDLADQLERLGALHAEGVLDDDEFAAAKARVLGRG